MKHMENTRQMRFKKHSDNKYVDIITGEIVDYEAAIKILDKENNETKIFNELIQSEKEIIKKENGWVDPKEKYTFNWNNNKNNPKFFYKGYKEFQKKQIKNLNITEIGLLTILSMYLESQTNKVCVNGVSPTNKQIQNLSGLGETTIKKSLSSLKDRNLIVTIGRGTGREIYVNPYWSFDGNTISNNTLNLFNINK